jgi:D-serine deaminase-like pyridoxal phosphate-dependent protein
MSATLPAINADTLRELLSPSMIVFRDRVVSNIEMMVRMAGSVQRLRPHCKTHKMPAAAKLLLEHGITRHKAATIAEVEMLAQCGAADVMLAYNPVGPNIGRVIALVKKFPNCRISVTADHPTPLGQLAEAARDAAVTVSVFIDVNTGMNRTGVAPDSDAARTMARLINETEGVALAGLHVYDGHLKESDVNARRAAVLGNWQRVQAFRQHCEADGIRIPVLVCGGTPTFPVYCEFEDPEIELSPGTSIFFDTGYGQSFPDLPFEPAAAVLTRVVSCPAADCITLDLGTKAVASDPPKGARVVFPDMPEAVQIGHNEEHLQLQFSGADRYQPGDAILGIPVHVCPTSALYDRVPVIKDGCVVDYWEVAGRNRVITI